MNENYEINELKAHFHSLVYQEHDGTPRSVMIMCIQFILNVRQMLEGNYHNYGKLYKSMCKFGFTLLLLVCILLM